MPFLVRYEQDIPKDCSECPCSVHITTNEIYCHALQEHLEVLIGNRPEECDMIELDNKSEDWD